MLHRIKDALYFPVARYFAFFARIRLHAWKPRIVVITGSNGKTTTLHMFEAQLGGVARYSHHRNSSFGIPFDILDLDDAAGSRLKWLVLAAHAPLHALKRPPSEKIYVVEADCDRPGEGKFLSELLQPEVVVWQSCARTHSARFERAMRSGKFPTLDDAIAYEYGYFLERAKDFCIVNGDDSRIMRQTSRGRARITTVTEASDLQRYGVSMTGTEFAVRGVRYSFPYLLPKDVFRAIAAAETLAEYLGVPKASELANFKMPPGRSSVFKGIKDTTIIDSSYNANAGSVGSILTMVSNISGTTWLIFGDMTEQGEHEGEEHEKVARLIGEIGFARVVLVGPRARKFVLPILTAARVPVESFIGPDEALRYVQGAIAGGEILVFKGARFLEGIIEHMLADRRDVEKLCRREPLWRRRRKEWGL